MLSESRRPDSWRGGMVDSSVSPCRSSGLTRPCWSPEGAAINRSETTDPMPPFDRSSFDRNNEPAWSIPGRSRPSTRRQRLHGMNRPPRHARSNRSILLLAFVLALVWRGETVRADAISSPHLDAESHTHRCKCASRCRGDSCCCGRSSASRQRAPASIPVTPRAEANEASGPCLGEAPCRDPGLPNSTPPGPTARAAALTLSPVWRPSIASESLPPPASGRLLSGRSSRIDRPPRA